ncbi:MAG: GDSL-type esterase/lipase family protein [Vicinamibacteria bacterium]|nr:GDSL-type esterase/lipase family protein [Vicinamibacteria bacterium]
MAIQSDRAPCSAAGAIAAAALSLLASGCGGSPASPDTGASASHSVTGVVFYDQNGSGTLDAEERVRLPGAVVSAAGRTATADARGEFTITGLPGPSATLSLPLEGLPPWFEPGRLPSLTLPLPAGTVVAVPAVLPTGRNHPNTYLAFGDSITESLGATLRQGWPILLERQLKAAWGEASVIADGLGASRSEDGARRLPDSLAEARPAYTLVLYGVNDWNRCAFVAPEACFTVASLRDMIRSARGAGSLPVVGTIVPVDPTSTAPRVADRNYWVKIQNELIRPMVIQEGAVLADAWTAFGPESQWPPLFFDFLHPNDEGHERIATAFAQAITRPRGAR